MNKKITIYDLLGLIKDGKPPKKIIYDNKKYFIEVHDYSLNDEKVFWLFKDNNIIQIMTKKVEILEEDKPIIEKIDLFDDLQDILNNSDESIVLNAIHKCLTTEKYKLNEIIEFLNRKEDK